MTADPAEPAPVGLDLDAITRFFRTHVPAIAGPLSARIIHGGRSNLTYTVTDGESTWVLRRPPLGLVAPTANDVVREYRVMHALQRSPVPVPPTVALCEDRSVIGVPFTVTGYVPGPVIRSPADAAGLSPEQARRCGLALVDELARLHAVVPAEVGLADFGRPEGFAQRQVHRWRKQWQVVATRQLPQLDQLYQALLRRLPASGTAAVVHGDYRLDNTILDPDDPGRVAAIVDWEMATLGDPLVDLGLLLAYWDPVVAPLLAQGHAISGNPGFPDRDEVAARYLERAGRAPGADLSFYRGLGYYKLAVIAEGIHHRYRQGLTVGSGFDTVASAVVPLLEAGLVALRADDNR